MKGVRAASMISLGAAAVTFPVSYLLADAVLVGSRGMAAAALAVVLVFPVSALLLGFRSLWCASQDGVAIGVAVAAIAGTMVWGFLFYTVYAVRLF